MGASDSYLGEIRLFAGNYAPQYWAFCDGQMLTIHEYAELYSLLGTTYGGNGRTTFALPDMRGRLPIHQGEGPRLTPRTLGESFGEAEVRLSTEQIPKHNHPMQASTAKGSRVRLSRSMLATNNNDIKDPYIYSTDTTKKNTTALSPTAISSTGDNHPHTNTMPTLGLSFIICTRGTYPSRR